MTTLAVRKLDSPLKKWKKYTSLQESGADWVSQIPSHWRAGRIRYVARLESGHTPSRQHPEYWSDCTIPWFTLADVWQLRDGSKKYVNETTERISELGLANSSARLLPEGTVILSRTASVGFTGILDRPMATSQDFVNWICGPRILPEYLWYVFRGMRQEFERLMMGSTHQTIYMPQVQSFATPIPPIPEQRAIIGFLDRETAKLDALIAKKQRLIELLQEKRTALISHAVTEGLDPGVLLKDSGIAWLGMIPAKWERVTFRHCVEIAEGQVDPKDDRFKASVLIAPNHIESGTGRLILTETADEQGAISGKYLYNPGDVIYSKIRPELRKACLPSVPGLCSADMYPLSVRRKLLPDYLLYTLLSEYFTQLTVVISERVAMPKVNREDLGDCYILVPPLLEQREIVEYLQGSTAKLDGLTPKVREGLEKLREYRNALISAAVTGKIDVRGEVE